MDVLKELCKDPAQWKEAYETAKALPSNSRKYVMGQIVAQNLHKPPEETPTDYLRERGCVIL